ncbi:hypothetical protein DGG96_13170 [Legionella qingyii]|uniref:Uncharacterized protein n=1 Tax=Legionella qingyii TaxID=2184757 RepID=A0A317U1L3_9GAMM|nr:hypothetical protein [Legionella qingyii]PWY55128.1 hypothetical protein DGG96_13170 [Legionella qingyii]RUR25449.1 hypothetical protein ELY20_03045 [Legionella qingyii]RUR28441.1 hypothetical protein ELY16_02965 [Legionella qingyii]
MNEINVEQLKNLLNEATKSIKSSESLLDELLKAPEEESSSIEDTICSIQLVLQYRLGNQDTLALLLSIDQNLLYLLDIQPRHSSKMNMDRLAYALGNEDLKQVIHMLSLLVSSLLKITNRYQKDHLSFELKAYQRKHIKQNILIKGMQKLILQQDHFLSLMRNLQENVTLLLEHQSVGPVFDHIAALRGPISQFYQATLHGLGVAKELYEKINKNELLNQKVELLLKQAEEVLKIMPSIYKPQPHYTLTPPSNTLTQPSNTLTQLRPLSAEQLEQRAAAKRLRPFFN